MQMKFAVALAVLLLHQDGDEAKADDLICSLEPSQSRILSREPLHVLLQVANSGSDPIELVDRQPWLEYRAPGAEQPCRTFLDNAALVSPRRSKLRPCESRSWGKRIGPASFDYVEGPEPPDPVHAFPRPGRYELRGRFGALRSRPVVIEVAAPEREIDRNALDALEREGLARSIDPATAPRSHETIRALERFASRFEGSAYAEHAMLVLGTLLWRGTDGDLETRQPERAVRLADDLASRQSPLPFRACYLQWQILWSLGKGEEALETLDKVLADKPGGYDKFILRAWEKHARPPAAAEPEQPKPTETRLWLQGQSRSQGPWLPVWFVVRIAPLAALYKPGQPRPTLSLRVRSKGQSEWKTYRPGQDVAWYFGLPGSKEGLSVELEPFLPVQLDADGSHPFAEPGEYQVSAAIGNLESNVVEVRVDRPSEAERERLAALRREGLIRYTGLLSTGWIPKEDRDKVRRAVQGGEASVHLDHLRITLARTLKMEAGSGRLSRTEGSGKGAWALYSKVAEGSGEAAGRALFEMMQFVEWAEAEPPDARRRAVEEMQELGRLALTKWSCPVLRWMVERHLARFGR
jgi:hypothetical protein